MIASTEKFTSAMTLCVAKPLFASCPVCTAAALVCSADLMLSRESDHSPSSPTLLEHVCRFDLSIALNVFAGA
jgi:hypothetical protein